jgi:hypothetical protein
MRIIERLTRWLRDAPFTTLEPRRTRRKAARLRHQQTGEPLWGKADRHENPPEATQTAGPGTPSGLEK